MYITSVKIAVVEALNAAFNALGPRANDYTLELTPRSITIEYPMEEVNWPAVFVQFRPSKTQWSGLNPDAYINIIGGYNFGSDRTLYFEGAIDLQILALHSEERDRLWDTLYNLILMDPWSPASRAFYSSLIGNDLLGITTLPSTVTSLGDTVAPGTPWSPEELTYESTIRIPCVGDVYESKYSTTVSGLQQITVSGTIVPFKVQQTPSH